MTRWNPGYCKQGHCMDESNTYTSPSGFQGCRTCIRNRRKTWLQTSIGNKYSKSISYRRHSRYYFGGKSDIVYERDNYRCVVCSMTMEEHIQKYGFRLTIDHIDNNGCNKPPEKKNNNLSNLQTLCCSCHGKKDGANRKRKSKISNE